MRLADPWVTQGAQRAQTPNPWWDALVAARPAKWGQPEKVAPVSVQPQRLAVVAVHPPQRIAAALAMLASGGLAAEQLPVGWIRPPPAIVDIDWP